MKNNNLVKGFLCLGIVSLSIGCTNLDEQILDGVANDKAGASIDVTGVTHPPYLEILMVKEVFMQWMKCLLTQWLTKSCGDNPTSTKKKKKKKNPVLKFAICKCASRNLGNRNGSARCEVFGFESMVCRCSYRQRTW
jgi:hypothetical protein